MATGRGANRYRPTHLPQRYQENHTSPTQIIAILGAAGQGRPPVGPEHLFARAPISLVMSSRGVCPDI